MKALIFNVLAIGTNTAEHGGKPANSHPAKEKTMNTTRRRTFTSVVVSAALAVVIAAVFSRGGHSHAPDKRD
jgi:hypothetical protein